MANAEIRLAVQRALDKLINRFGSHAEVVGELRAALRLMEREEAPASSGGKEAAIIVTPEPDTVTGSGADEPEQAETAPEPPVQPKRGYGGKRK